MAVYVTPIHEYPEEIIAPRARKYGTKWCHMAADTEEELHAMARKMHISRRAFQPRSRYPHYDLIPKKRLIAIEYGAIEMADQALFKRLTRDERP